MFWFLLRFPQNRSGIPVFSNLPHLFIIAYERWLNTLAGCRIRKFAFYIIIYVSLRVSIALTCVYYFFPSYCKSLGFIAG